MKNIVLIPGLLNNATLFRGQINTLSAKYNLFVADHTKLSTMSQIAEDILYNQNMPQTFILGGLSMGGYIAMEMLRQAPDRIEGLIIMNSSAKADTLEQKQRRLSLINLSTKGKFKGITAQLLPHLLHQNAIDNPLIPEVIYDMAADIGQENFVRQQTAILQRINSHYTLKKWKKPACILVGDEDKLTPPERAQEMHALMPHSELHIIPECGHLSTLEYPDEVSDIIDHFISTLHSPS